MAAGPARVLTRADLMTAHEVASKIGVPVSTVLHWGRSGVLPRIKLGRRARFIRAHVEAALLGLETGPDGQSGPRP